jgi:hypothetical protein
LLGGAWIAPIAGGGWLGRGRGRFAGWRVSLSGVLVVAMAPGVGRSAERGDCAQARERGDEGVRQWPVVLQAQAGAAGVADAPPGCCSSRRIEARRRWSSAHSEEIPACMRAQSSDDARTIIERPVYPGCPQLSSLDQAG